MFREPSGHGSEQEAEPISHQKSKDAGPFSPGSLVLSNWRVSLQLKLMVQERESKNYLTGGSAASGPNTGAYGGLHWTVLVRRLFIWPWLLSFLYSLENLQATQCLIIKALNESNLAPAALIKSQHRPALL